MRIDSGLSNLLYHSRFQRDDSDLENATPEAAVARPRAATNPAVSSTLLSQSLASALWTVEGGKSNAAPIKAEEPATVQSSARKVEAFYLEYALPADEMH